MFDMLPTPSLELRILAVEYVGQSSRCMVQMQSNILAGVEPGVFVLGEGGTGRLLPWGCRINEALPDFKP